MGRNNCYNFEDAFVQEMGGGGHNNVYVLNITNKNLMIKNNTMQGYMIIFPMIYMYLFKISISL